MIELPDAQWLNDQALEFREQFLEEEPGADWTEKRWPLMVGKGFKQAEIRIKRDREEPDKILSCRFVVPFTMDANPTA